MHKRDEIMGSIQHLIGETRFFSKIVVGYPACGETPYLPLRFFQRRIKEVPEKVPEFGPPKAGPTRLGIE